MAQHADIALPALTFTRADFTALRAWVQRVPLDRIAHLYYAEDAPQVLNGLEKHLTAMRHDLIERAVFANPKLADALAKARQGGPITAGILDLLVKAADAKPSPPKSTHLCAQWFRPSTARALATLEVRTLDELKQLIESRGPNWWRPVPRLGEKRARAVERWLNRHAETALDPSHQVVLLDAQNHTPLSQTPLPVERIASLPHTLDGHDGRNRATAFCFIQAKNDLEALRAYLEKFRHQPHTHRAYQRELERLLLWCVIERRTPLSSMLVHDCEAYKDFLAAPSPLFCGPRERRLSPRWKPFTGPLSPTSQRQATQIIRSAFVWLQDVRYLSGNPWAAVTDPRTDVELLPMQINRALPLPLWDKILLALDDLCADPNARQHRVGRAAILVMGESGLRISEAASALRSKIERSQDADLWLLAVLGKRSKWRYVPLSPRTYEALLAHWDDAQNHTPLSDQAPLPLITPLQIAPTDAAHKKLDSNRAGYEPRSLSRVVEKTFDALCSSADFSAEEVVKIRTLSAHALRHTFGVHAVAKDMSLNVVQAIFGHESLDTTSIYVRAGMRELALESEKLFSKSA